MQPDTDIHLAAAALGLLNGTAGNDTLVGTASDEQIDGLGGNDEVHSGGGNDILRGGSGDDAIYSGPGNDSIDGGDGYDYLYYSEATAGVTINLRTGTATGGAGNDTIAGIELVFGSRFNDTYVGNDAGIGFLGGDGDDNITGGAGRDHLEGNAGDDTIDGMGGIDVAAYYSAASAVNVNLATGKVTGGLGNDTLRNIEDVTGSVFGDTLAGSPGDNRLEGSDGDDTLISTSGNDVLDGGNGLDTVIYALSRTAYRIDPAGEGRQIIAKLNAAASDSLIGIERLQFSDTRVALDLEGHAGQTARLIGVVFGASSLLDKGYVGIGLGLLDAGTTYEQLGKMALDAAGATRPADIVGLMWKNLYGSAPTAAEAAPYVALLDSGQTSVGALAVLAADLELNAVNINLSGLMQSGIEFTLYTLP